VPPDGPPIGLLLSTTSKNVGRAFNDALAVHGGSIPIWLILNALKRERRRTQLELARAVGIEGPTMTRHLDRRAVQVQLTRAGHALHGRLLKAVIAFNQQLRTGLSSDDIETLRRVLGQLQLNVA
jgi:MarR family transcriptional regulator, transcriptional regulator for hemolysin